MNTHDKIKLPPHDATANIDGVVVTRLYSEAKVRAAIEADRKRRGEPVAPEGFRLIAVNEAFDSLMFWLDRCEQKGHLENCPDLAEPWEKFEYREVEAPQPAEPDRGEPVEWSANTNVNPRPTYQRPPPPPPPFQPMAREYVERFGGLVRKDSAPQPADPTVKESLTVAEPVKEVSDYADMAKRFQKRADEIEALVAFGKMSAAACFTQMRQLVPHPTDTFATTIAAQPAANVEPITAFKTAFHAASEHGASYDDAVAEGLRAAPVAAQPSVPECPYPCGWGSLHKMATKDGAYLAKSLVVGHLLTDNERATAIVASIRLIEVCRTMLKAAPEVKP